jgi:hypothetical protein
MKASEARAQIARYSSGIFGSRIRMLASAREPSLSCGHRRRSTAPVCSTLPWRSNAKWKGKTRVRAAGVSPKAEVKLITISLSAEFGVRPRMV